MPVSICFRDDAVNDAPQVRKNERKAFADKQQDVEWLSYELRAYRSKYSQLRDERDKQATLLQQLQVLLASYC